MRYNINELLHEKKVWQRSDFVFFWGHSDRAKGQAKACLSQWYPCSFIVDEQYYNCMEQYMMAEKARVFGDEEVYDMILREYNPMNLKKMGRKVKNYNDDIWKSKRYDIVVKGNMAKFSQNTKMNLFLEETVNKVIAEASPKDMVWGIGLEEMHEDAIKPGKWPGENLLGFALMEVRDTLRSK
ncbi:NADAR family protein [uncultured Parabacteroides sp.]|uniref:NADAR family protein n=1 Tax=uncultured Parabacteroides sp. TaxID=512312 RepID=UPI00261D5E46|nr:NADAR family protein [uncultured Parabacteroides sp.]